MVILKIFILILTCYFQIFSYGEEAPPVYVKVNLEPSIISSENEALLTFELKLQPGYHGYDDMFKVNWVTDDGVTLSPLEIAPTKIFSDPFTGKKREAMEDHGSIKTHVHFPTFVEAGNHKSQIDFTYQICSAKKCLLPKTLHLTVEFLAVPNSSSELRKSPPALQVLGEGESKPLDALQMALARGKLWAFVFVFFGGLLTSLTPCVFPMIPITVSIIGARSTNNRKSRSFLLSVCYVLGIAFTYSILGLVAASSGALFGETLGHAYVAVTIALVFFVMGLSMLGFFEIQMPYFIRRKMGAASFGSGLPGAFLAGLFAGVVASPCIGPVLVSILTYVARTAEKAFGFALLFTFAMGMGLLFIVLGTFTGLLKRLPKSGPWMESTKSLFGFILMGMAFYYLKPVLPEFYFNLILALVLFLSSIYYGAFTSIREATFLKHLKKGTLLALFLLSLYFALQVLNKTRTDQIQPVPVSKSKGGLEWQPYSEPLVLQAKNLRKPIIIDFSADWCVACHELDRFTYTDSEVIKEGARFLFLKVDATQIESVNDLLKKYEIVGLPTVIFIDREGKVHSEIKVLGFVKAGEFLKLMKKIEP